MRSGRGEDGDEFLLKDFASSFKRYVILWHAYRPILHVYKICTNRLLWFRFTVKQVMPVPWNKQY
jgi:hypothetical protein